MKLLTKLRVLAVVAALWGMSANLAATEKQKVGWVPADDAGAEVARVKLFFHFVMTEEEKKSAAKDAHFENSLNEYVRLALNGLEYQVPGQAPYNIGGINSAFRGTGIQFVSAGHDVVQVPKGIIDRGDYRTVVRYGKQPYCINVYLVDHVADGRGNLSGVCLSGDASVVVKYLDQPGLRGYVMSHELGHFFGLAHTMQTGIMGGRIPPVVTLRDEPAAGMSFTPSQIAIMKKNIPRFAVQPGKPQPGKPR